MTWVGNMPISLEEKIVTLNRFLIDGAKEVQELADIFRVYKSLPRAKPGFLFSIARRLMTVSLEKEAPQLSRQRFRSISLQLPPGKLIIHQLSEWVSCSYAGVDSSSTQFSNIVLNNERFMMHFSKAMALLVEEQNILTAVVSQ